MNSDIFLEVDMLKTQILEKIAQIYDFSGKRPIGLFPCTFPDLLQSLRVWVEIYHVDRSLEKPPCRFVKSGKNTSLNRVQHSSRLLI